MIRFLKIIGIYLFIISIPLIVLSLFWLITLLGFDFVKVVHHDGFMFVSGLWMLFGTLMFFNTFDTIIN